MLSNRPGGKTTAAVLKKQIKRLRLKTLTLLIRDRAKCWFEQLLEGLSLRSSFYQRPLEGSDVRVLSTRRRGGKTWRRVTGKTGDRVIMSFRPFVANATTALEASQSLHSTRNRRRRCQQIVWKGKLYQLASLDPFRVDGDQWKWRSQNSRGNAHGKAALMAAE